MSGISQEDVAHLANLARINISTNELGHYASQLDAILNAVAVVSSLDTSNVAAMSHPVPMTNVFREDIPGVSLTAEQALSGAPAVEDERFRVPRILDEE
ncbi:MAG: Asp-tRNA(Asn)/Glu-tRNA(Gln) amidotransferase subunit GatC [Candidatus Nanopelagicales bacterium]|nr:Asp-tRNA(Asn)/Glu-tRNA(Gln) amidotransferase subunit GatC [Candidatus Nanopelagicales bacterium]